MNTDFEKALINLDSNKRYDLCSVVMDYIVNDRPISDLISKLDIYHIPFTVYTNFTLYRGITTSVNYIDYICAEHSGAFTSDYKIAESFAIRNIDEEEDLTVALVLEIKEPECISIRDLVYALNIDDQYCNDVVEEEDEYIVKSFGPSKASYVIIN